MGKARKSRIRIDRRRSRAGDTSEKSGAYDRPVALTYFMLGIVLVAITASLLLWLLRPLPALRGKGFAWLAIPEQPGFGTKKVDLMYKVELRHGMNPLVEYDVLAHCGNKTTTVALYLDGLSRLKDIHLLIAGHERAVSGKLPELGYQSGMQLISGTIVDGPICKAKGSIKAGTVMSLQGTATAPLAYSDFSQGEIALPVVGYPWTSNEVVNSPPGLRGNWLSPLSSKVNVNVFPLPLQDRIDIARPATESGSSLDWSASNTIGVSAIWTNTARDQAAQIYIFLLGILGGIGGTLVVEGVEPGISILLKKLGSKLKQNSKRTDT
jgi:hypothetical protein